MWFWGIGGAKGRGIRAVAWGLACSIMVAGLVFAGPARADLFAVGGVEVDATASNAADARELAHREGWREAFAALTRRLTRQSDWSRLPQPTDARLAQMAAGLSIEDERNSQNRYLARITYSFKPEAVRELLTALGIPFSESKSAPLLVIPVLEVDGRLTLWEDDNPWRAVWANRADTDGLVPVVAPLGDLTDIAALSATQVINADWLDLQPLVERYGASAALVVIAQQQSLSAPGDPFARSGGTPAGDDPDGAVDPMAAPVPVTGSVGPGDVRLDLGIVRLERGRQASFTGSAKGPATTVREGDTVYVRAMDEVMAIIARDWKSRTLVDFNARFTMPVTVPLASIQDWTDIKQRLDKIPNIVSYDTTVLSHRGAELSLIFAGTVDQLALALDQNGLMLSGEQGYWEISRQGIVPASLTDAKGSMPRIFPVQTQPQGEPYERSGRARTPAWQQR